MVRICRKYLGYYVSYFIGFEYFIYYKFNYKQKKKFIR